MGEEIGRKCVEEGNVSRQLLIYLVATKVLVYSSSFL